MYELNKITPKNYKDCLICQESGPLFCQVIDKKIPEYDIEEIDSSKVNQKTNDENYNPMIKSPTFRFFHCAKVYIHSECLAEWLLHQGNSCIFCREECYEDIEQNNLIMTLHSFKTEILKGKINYEIKDIYQSESDNIPKFDIVINSENDFMESPREHNVDNEVTSSSLKLIHIFFAVLLSIFITLIVVFLA